MIMLSKEEFKQCIEFIKEQNKKQDVFVKALETLSPGNYCDCWLYSAYENKYVELIKKLMNDECDDIDYFLYDMPDFTGKYSDSESKLPFIDIDSLYNHLVKLDNERAMEA